MIVGSLLLILVAVVLLVLGLIGGSGALLIGSIAASLLAAIALVVGARQHNAAPVDEVDDAAADDGYGSRAAGRDDARSEFERAERDRADAFVGAGARAGRGGTRAGALGDASGDTPTVTLPAQPAYAPPVEPDRPAHQPEPPRWDDSATTTGSLPVVGDDPTDDEYDDEDPPDEPAPQLLTEADAARVARMSADVLVIDGRPRYHLAGCVHLLGRESEPLPVSEAAELGFTPCSLCEPANSLLTDFRH